MRQYTSFVGMDTHARSIALASFDSATGELATGRLTGCPGAAEVAAWASGHTTGPTLFAYESGPIGSAWVPSEGAGADPSLPWAVERWTSAGADGLWGLSC